MGIRVSNVTSQVMFSPSDILQNVSDTLSFVEEPFSRSVQISNITVQILQLQSGRLYTLAQEMELTDLVTVLNAAGDRQVIEDTLNFSQEATVPSHPILEDVLAFTQNARSSIWNINLNQALHLNQYAVYCLGTPWAAIEITDTLAFVHSASKVAEVSVTDTLTLTQSFVQVNAPIGDGHFLDLEQSVSVGFGYDLSDELEFTQTIQTFSDYLRSVTHSDVVEQSLTYYIDNPCNKKQYARFVGEGSASDIAVEGLLFDASFVLESIEDGTLLALRNPETDDVDRLGFNRVNRETRGGELNVYSDPVWAEVNSLLFTITALPDGDGSCPDTLSAVLQFMQDTLGEEIYLHDWTGVSWRGVITSPDEAATEDADGYWTVTFEFEGIPESGSVPQNVMNIQDSVTFNADWNRPLSDTLDLTQTVTVGGDINISVSDTLNLSQSLAGSEQEIDILVDNMSAGATSVTLDGQSPDTGSETWRAHTNFLDDGSTSAPIDAGAYYPVSLVDDTVYELTMSAAFMNAYNDGDNGIFGFFENISSNNTINGPVADGSLNPTCAKVVHLMRETSGAVRNNAYRLGTESDGTATTIAWTDGTLNSSADATLDLRIVIDTTGGEDNWTATWYAKGVISPNYTEVGPATSLLSENIGAVGWAMDSLSVDAQLTGTITLKELRPVE